MLELADFGHIATPAIQIESRDNVFGDVMGRNYDVIMFISK